MLRKKTGPKAKKGIADALLRDMQGSTAEKLALFEEMREHGAFDACFAPSDAPVG